MGLLIRTTPNKRSSLENPNLDLNDPDIWAQVFGESYGTSSAGVAVNNRTALAISGVWRGVNLIANTVAKVPLYVYRRQQDGQKERDTGHAAYPILRRQSSPWHNAFEFRRTLTAQAILRGNGYAAIIRPQAGSILSVRDGGGLLPLQPDRTYPVKANGTLYYVTSVGGVLEDTNSELVRLEYMDVLHIRGLGADGLGGYPLLDLARDDFGLDIAQTKYSGKFFANNATGRVVLEVPSELSDKAFQRLQHSWNSLNTGLDNAHKTAILEEGTTANPLASTMKDAQLIEGRKFSLTSVANWLQLPPHKVGAEGRTSYNSLSEENQSTLDESYEPWLCAWESECYAKLLTEREKQAESHEVEFERKALLRSNPAQRAEFYRQAVGRPFMLPDEARKAENMPPIDGGDELYVPVNMAPAGQQPDSGPDTDQMRDIRKLARSTARRIAKRILLNLKRGKPAIDGTVRESLVPFDSLAGQHCIESETRFAGFVSERSLEHWQDEMTPEQMDAAAENIAAEAIHGFTWE